MEEQQQGNDTWENSKKIPAVKRQGQGSKERRRDARRRMFGEREIEEACRLKYAKYGIIMPEKVRPKDMTEQTVDDIQRKEVEHEWTVVRKVDLNTDTQLTPRLIEHIMYQCVRVCQIIVLLRRIKYVYRLSISYVRSTARRTCWIGSREELRIQVLAGLGISAITTLEKILMSTRARIVVFTERWDTYDGSFPIGAVLIKHGDGEIVTMGGIINYGAEPRVEEIPLRQCRRIFTQCWREEGEWWKGKPMPLFLRESSTRFLASWLESMVVGGPTEEHLYRRVKKNSRGRCP